MIAHVPFDEGALSGRIRPNATFPEGDWRNDSFGGDRKTEVWERALALSGELGVPVEEVPEIALRFCLSHPAVSTAIAGMRSLEDVDANAAAAGRGRLGEQRARGAVRAPLGQELLRLRRYRSIGTSTRFPHSVHEPS